MFSKKSLIRKWVFITAPLLVANAFIGSPAAVGTTAKPAITSCSAKYLTQRAIGRYSSSADSTFFSLVFTNHGKVACSLSGIPRAQAVFGAKHSSVGPNALNNPVPSRGLLVVLPPDKGISNVQYGVMSNQGYLKVQCSTHFADGVVVTFHISTKIFLTAFLSFGKYHVCTKFRSTSVTSTGAGVGR